jgi:hypothetical protein
VSFWKYHVLCWKTLWKRALVKFRLRERSWQCFTFSCTEHSVVLDSYNQTYFFFLVCVVWEKVLRILEGDMHVDTNYMSAPGYDVGNRSGRIYIDRTAAAAAAIKTLWCSAVNEWGIGRIQWEALFRHPRANFPGKGYRQEDFMPRWFVKC